MPTVVVVYSKEEELLSTPARVSARRAQIAKMTNEGKTNGVVTRPSPTVVELTFINQAAAEEWVTWCNAAFADANVVPVSIEIR